MELAKEKAAELGEDVDHNTAVKINHGTLSKIQSKVGMTQKVIVTSREEYQETNEKL